jgi:hypothetical protein
MASSMKLEYPLSDVLPSIEHARDRLLARIYRYRLDCEASQQTTDEDCALLYAYSELCHVILFDPALTLIPSPRDRPIIKRDHGDHWGDWTALWCIE